KRTDDRAVEGHRLSGITHPDIRHQRGPYVRFDVDEMKAQRKADDVCFQNAAKLASSAEMRRKAAFNRAGGLVGLASSLVSDDRFCSERHDHRSLHYASSKPPLR